jgi:poly(3-hydroxybutyrate) depolymerase
MFTVDGTQRSTSIHIDVGAAASLDGPVVFYWYGTGGQPSQATSGLGTEGIARITSAGGIVVAPTHINAGVFPWIGGGDVDFRLMDEVVACAEQKIGIDETHIHSLGFSAGGLFTTQVSFTRQSYVASVATYSGGGGGVMTDPSNRFAAMIMHGGPNDMVVINFQDSSQQYYDQIKAAGHFAALCNHGGGHSIPNAARPAVVQFFFDHPFKAPSPYAGGFPIGFPSYCVP